MVIKARKEYKSEHDLLTILLWAHNLLNDWGITETQIEILTYLIRYGYSKKTKEIICKNVGITPTSLNTNLSYLRQGKMGKKKIPKLLELHPTNINLTTTVPELDKIKDFVESKDKNKIFYFEFYPALKVEDGK